MQFQCDQCDRSYKHQKTLNDHLKNECGKTANFSCTKCEYRTKWKQNLRAHFINVHEMKRSQLALFVAGNYSNYFIYYPVSCLHLLRLCYLITGPKVRPVMAFKCDQCERTYSTKFNLQRHVVKEHSNE